MTKSLASKRKGGHPPGGRGPNSAEGSQPIRLTKFSRELKVRALLLSFNFATTIRMAAIKDGIQIAFLLAIFVVFCAGLFVVVERTFSTSFQECVAAAEESPSAFVVMVSYARCTARISQSYEALITALAIIVIAAFAGTLWWATRGQGT
jgi:hypothetical protein